MKFFGLNNLIFPLCTEEDMLKQCVKNLQMYTSFSKVCISKTLHHNFIADKCFLNVEKLNLHSL